MLWRIVGLNLLSLMVCKLSFAQPADSLLQSTPFSQDSSFNVGNSSAFTAAETRFQQILVSFATSYSANQNWQSTDYKNFSLTGNADYQYSISSKKFLRIYQFGGEL